KDREIEMLQGRLDETATRLAEKEKALESARLAEAALQSRMEEQQHHHREKLELLEQTRERLNEEFKQLAGEIFEAKHRTFKQESREQLDNMLKPLGERIREFEKRVEKTYSDESRERFSLIKEVKNLQDLNAKISEDAVNLTNALKGHSKTQGTWGEVSLERVLERSGLEKDREYEIQVNMKTEEGRRLQPDVVVHLPEEKDVIIDAKVSLTAYERFCSTEDEAERQASLKAHIQSIRSHIKRLSDKDYQNLEAVRTLDFVLLFVPVEAAFSLAVQEDGELFSDAFDLNIVVVSPSTLLATLRTIQNIWRYEQQNRNAQEIAGKAGALYDKFVNFVSDLEDIGARLASAQNAWESAHNKLTTGRGNLVRRAEDMKELGARVSKSLPKNLVEMPLRDSARVRETR
ncbi:MAG: DNA recombination protein RmuC, partial [Pseudomonadales bacterium]|nr:DNA recombination protein RmuC [Pseudomonadales bacterium]